MAQIIKHRRGSIASLKGTTARNAELIIASGSISDLSGPFVFIGSPNSSDEGVAGAFNVVSKIYQGNSAPTLSAGTYGSTLDGTPFYSTGGKALYALQNSNVGNTKFDLTGNIEGNTISGVTILALTSSVVSASFVGDASGLYNLSLTGITGLELNKIVSGSATASISPDHGLQVNVDTEITGALYVSNGITGDTISSTHQGDGTNFQVGDDVWIGDINIANTMQVAGQENVNEGYIQFGSHTGTTNTIGSDGTNLKLVSYNEIDLYGYNEIYLHGDNFNSYLDMYTQYTELYSDGSMYLVGETYMDIHVNDGNIWISSYTGGILHLNNDETEGDVHILNGGGNALYIYGDVYQTSGKTINTDKLVGVINPSNIIDLNDIVVGDLGLFSNNNVNVSASYVYISGSNSTKIGQLDNSAYFYTSPDYAEMYSLNGLDIQANGGSLWVYNNAGNVAISSYDGSTLYLNTDGGEGDVHIGNSGNSLYTYLVNAEISGSIYAELHSGNEYVWAESGVGAFLESDTNGISGFSARINGIAEITGALKIVGDTQIDGNTSVTGALVVSNGSATFDQGLVAQNSNMLLTSGSNLVIQNGGNISVDYIYGNTQQWNYLALNGGALGAPNVELSSAGDISLYAEGGTVNVTGSMRVTGDIIFSGSINLGDMTGDTINFNGEVNSNILPTTGSMFDLGSSGQTWANIYADTAHFTNISLDTISFSGLTEGRVILGGPAGSLVDSGSLNFNADVLNISGSIHLNTDAYIYNDSQLYIEDHTNGVVILSNNYAELQSQNAYVWVENGEAYVEGNTFTKIYTNSGNVEVSSYDDGILKLNNNGGEGDINAGNGSNSLYVTTYNAFITGSNETYLGNENYNSYFYTSNNYAEMVSNNQLYINGYGYVNVEYNEGDSGLYLADDGDYSAQLYSHIGGVALNSYNGYDVRINTFGGEGDVYILNGGNELHVDGNSTFTGSMHVSNGLAFVNEGVLAQNSDLTLTSGSNLRLEDNGHFYIHNCGDIYFDNNSGNVVFYNDCNNFNFQNAVSISGSLNMDNSSIYINNNNTLYTNNIYGNNGGDLYIQTDNSTLYLNSSYETYIDSNNYTSIGWGDESNYTYYESNGVYTYSSYIEQSVVNNSGEYNYIYLENDGVYLQTAHYNGTGTTTHDVWLDNTGSLRLTNVNFVTDGDLQIGGNTSITGALYVSGTTHLSGSVTTYGDLYVSGNLQVLGSSTNVNIQSHTVEIGDNIILVNAYSPFQRYAGIAGYDSGSSGNSGSLLWDSLNNYWNFVDQANNSSKVIGTTAAALGSEISLTTNTVPVATSANTIGDSLITDDGTVFAYNTNKFTVTGSTGDTYIAGNLTIAGVGGTDNGEATSYVVFRNNSDQLGFVDVTDTTTESDALLGYNTSTGVLQFSSLLDGGTY